MKFVIAEKPNKENLLAHGFRPRGEGYFWKTSLHGGEFLAEFYFCEGAFTVTLFDAEFLERYALFDVEEAQGALIGELREEVEEILLKIRRDCFPVDGMRKKLFAFAKEKFESEPDYPWQDENAVLRNEKGKWYALFMRIPAQKLIPQASGEVEVMNIKLPPARIAERTDLKTVFPAWHMNKKYWVTVLLSGALPLAEAEELLAESYACVKK